MPNTGHSKRPLRLGTRGSALARAQAVNVADLLATADPTVEVELVVIATSGDEGSAGAGGADKERFVKEIEDALLTERIDLAVHSAKDVPGRLPDGLRIVGVPARADARDALCGADSLAALVEGARVGTGSARRAAQLLATRPDLRIEPLRGNVDTRLRKRAGEGLDAIVLAMAGLERLGRAGEGVPIETDLMTPAAGQGCLALEARAGDETVAELAAMVTDEAALHALTAERSLVAAIGAGCESAVGAHALIAGEEIALSAFVGTVDGSTWIRDSATGDDDDPGSLGREVGGRLLEVGAAELIASAPPG